MQDETDEPDPGENSYSLVEPFDVDSGELDGVRPALVFCLGYEFCQVRDAAKSGDPFHRTIHAENASRLKRMLIRKGRKFRVEPCKECADEWAFLTVAGADGEFPPERAGDE